MKITSLADAPFGAALRMVAATSWVEAASAEQLAMALHHHGVLLVRGEALDEQHLVALGEAIGPLDTVYPVEHRTEGNVYIRLQTNIPGLGVNGGGLYWHADGPWKPEPGATLLRCVESPARSGATLFADMRLAWDALDEADRRHLRELVGWFPIRQTYLDDCRSSGQAVNEQRLASLKDLQHPIVRQHPVTGREALYLNEAGLASVLGLDSLENDALLRRLYGHATEGRFVYRHEWRVGDVLIWDNACVMHKAERSAAGTRKITHRVTTSGFHPRGEAYG